MIFKINNDEWNIVLMDKENLKKKYNEEYEEEATFVFGLTIYPENEIWINRDMCFEQQLRTLKHELTHCYIWSFGLKNTPNFTEEMVCDIVAAISPFIDDVVANFKANIIHYEPAKKEKK